MANLTLVLGNKRYSSWSLRPWLALRQAGIAFDEVVIRLNQPDTAASIARHSPTGLVPVLIADGQPIWESLAICEFAAEMAPALWPAQAPVRALARAVAAEMHAGFAALRRHCPTDFVARHKAPPPLPDEVHKDIARIGRVWGECRRRFGADGPFLFGAFSIADAMYAPVVSRFLTYALPRDPISSSYMDAILALPAWQEWQAAGAREPAMAAPSGAEPHASREEAPVVVAGSGVTL